MSNYWTWFSSCCSNNWPCSRMRKSWKASRFLPDLASSQNRIYLKMLLFASPSPHLSLTILSPWYTIYGPFSLPHFVLPLKFIKSQIFNHFVHHLPSYVHLFSIYFPNKIQPNSPFFGPANPPGASWTWDLRSSAAPLPAIPRAWRPRGRRCERAPPRPSHPWGRPVSRKTRGKRGAVMGNFRGEVIG